MGPPRSARRAGLLVKELDAVVIGFYAWSELGAGRAGLELLLVEPWAIGRGQGRQLLAHACEREYCPGVVPTILRKCRLS
jgi:hypothetical protein